MGIKIKLAAMAISILIISGCSINNSKPDEEMDHSTMNQDMMENDHMSHDEVVSLNDSTGENELKIPSMLERDDEEGIVYTVRARKGKTEIFDGVETNTYGYNRTFLGPMLRFDKGDIVKIRTINED